MSLVTQYAYTLGYVVFFYVGQRYTDTEDKELRPWVRRLSESAWAYPFIGAAVAFCGWYTDVVMVPTIQSHIQAGPIMTVSLIVQVILGIGLGLPVAKWLTERAYRFWHNPHKDE